MLFSWLNSFILNGGIKPTDSVARARAIRIANLLGLIAVLNTLVFGFILFFLRDFYILNLSLYVATIYTLCLAINYFGAPTFGRVMLLIAGNAIVFYFACIFRGESNVQLLFYSLAGSTFMYFSWDERRYYSLIIIPVVFLVYGEYQDWEVFIAYKSSYDLRAIRMFAAIAPLFQITGAYYYFLKQSMRFETESLENQKKVEIEHQKQLQVQKMSSLGEMAGGVSHEINNPLMVIIGKTHQIKRDLRDLLPDEIKTFSNLDKIDAMVNRISKIVLALKNFSRNSEHDPSEKVSLDSILEVTLDLCRERFASHGITLSTHCQPDLFLFCRPTEISQVLLNLLNNAFDACLNVHNGIVFVNAISNNESVEIRISDNGSGINSEIAEKIMQPFFTTKEIGKGTGLGLSISKGLIEGHGGSLSYIPDSQQTIFLIILPGSQFTLQKL